MNDIKKSLRIGITARSQAGGADVPSDAATRSARRVPLRTAQLRRAFVLERLRNQKPRHPKSRAVPAGMAGSKSDSVAAKAAVASIQWSGPIRTIAAGQCADLTAVPIRRAGTAGTVH
jgi:hypothetical protein